MGASQLFALDQISACVMTSPVADDWPSIVTGPLSIGDTAIEGAELLLKITKGLNLLQACWSFVQAGAIKEAKALQPQLQAEYLASNAKVVATASPIQEHAPSASASPSSIQEPCHSFRRLFSGIVSA